MTLERASWLAQLMRKWGHDAIVRRDYQRNCWEIFAYQQWAWQHYLQLSASCQFSLMEERRCISNGAMMVGLTTRFWMTGAF